MRRAWALVLGVNLASCNSAPPAAPLRPVPDGILAPDEWAGKPVDGGTLTVIVPTEPAHLLYLVESDLTLWRLSVPHVYEPLLVPDPDDVSGTRFLPRLARSWTVSADGLVYTFALQPDARWHDGAPFTADDVVFTFDRVMDPAGRSAHVRSALTELAQWTRVDDHTVRFVFRKPYFLSLESVGSVPIFPKHLAGSGDLLAQAKLRHPIGTGPFRFVSWQPGSKRIVYERNDAWWGGRVHLDRLVFRVVEDRTVAAQLMARGEADAYLSYLPEQWLALWDDPSFAANHRPLKLYPGGYHYVGWNEARPFFQDRRVRMALAHLLNRPYVEQQLLKGLYVEHACALYFKGPDCDPSIHPPAYDPAAARTLLDEAGWIDHDGDGLRDKEGVRFRFTYMYPNGSVLAEQVGVVLRDELRRSGIEMDLQVLEWATFISRIHHSEFDATCLGWGGGPQVDPFSFWHSSEAAGRNWISFHDTEVDRIIELARAETDDEKRHALFRQFGQVLFDDQPYVWIGTAPTLGALSRRVHGARNTMDIDYAGWWLDDAVRHP